MSSQPIITLQNAGVRFGYRRSFFKRDVVEALRDVSLKLYHGDSLGVIGKNGAGKSTLLSLLGGIILPDTGRIVSQNIKTSLLALQVGFDPELSGRTNAILSGMLLGFRYEEVKSNLDKIIAFSELGGFIDKPVKTYSAGMRGRLGFSIALEMNPDVILIDEVLGVGDIDFRKKSMAVMKEKLLSDQTIVLVSHSGQIVKNFCNRVIWIEDGISKMDGNPKEVVDTYESYMAQKTKEYKIQN